MNPLYILAETAQTTETAQTAAQTEGIVPIDLFWEQITSLSLPEALTFIAFGAVCLMYGWRLFKTLVVISFALLGMAGGALAAQKISGSNHQILGGIIGLVLIGALALPLMKWAVSILGALAGGVVTSGLWYAVELPEKYIWAGSLIGIVAGGMIAFIALKWAVMLFSCLGGSAILITGFLALFYLWPDTQLNVQRLVFEENWFLPVALIVPTAFGFILQHKFIKRSAEWRL
ncbi:MAG: hypothetical protein JW804_02620 [Sedimentisphaerales bacterium]|nr:hypothetical protein [Sedimentisphaerales bacterium]